MMILLTYGLRLGIGDYLDEKLGYDYKAAVSPMRMIVDVSFFIIVIIILFNVVFGIIIDEFSAVREQREKREQEEKGRCFICGVSRNELEVRHNNVFAFRNHTQEHNMWTYFFFSLVFAHTNSDIFDIFGLTA